MVDHYSHPAPALSIIEATKMSAVKTTKKVKKNKTKPQKPSATSKRWGEKRIKTIPDGKNVRYSVVALTSPKKEKFVGIKKEIKTAKGWYVKTNLVFKPELGGSFAKVLGGKL